MANTRITQGVIKPNENYLVGILTAQSIDVDGVLTYEDVTSVDSIGIVTARKGIVSLGVVTATAFHGDGSQLTGIDATALKDSAGAVKIQALTTGAVHTGFSTMQNLRVTGIATFGTSSTVINGDQNTINVGTALTLGHTQGVQFHTQNLHADGFEINNINASGIITAAQFSGDGSNLENLPAGLGTALSSTQSSPLNKIYYTNTVLPVESTITVDTPASASAAYTQYADISVGTGADLIISDGDDLIPDVLGLRPDGTFGGGSLGRMRVDKLVGKDANSAVNIEKGLVVSGVSTSIQHQATNVNVTGVVTATAFYGSGANLTGLAADKIFEGNTKAEVIDSGSDGRFIVETDGVQRIRIDSNGLGITSTTTAARNAGVGTAIGTIIFNSTDNKLQVYANDLNWRGFSPADPTISSISGTLYAGTASTLTLAGGNFLQSNLQVRFIQNTRSVDVTVTVTPTSDSAATVNVPATVYNNIQGSDVVSINVTNSDGVVSNTVTKTAAGLPTGGTITTSGSYRIHTFTSNGDFIVPTGTTLTNVEYLVVGGGGGGGPSNQGHQGGGGGAGGLRTSVVGATSGRGSSAEARVTYTAGTYGVSVGAGGGSRSQGGGYGFNGVQSYLTLTGGGYITSAGGGGGGMGQNNGASRGGLNGGCGGGAASSDQSIAAPGSGTAGQGYDGGQPTCVGCGQGGAGGGAGGSGSVGGSGGVGSNNTPGGVGLVNNITGSNVTYATGGDCPGTAGNNQNPGAANTGNGGDGGYSNNNSPTGQAGGSGIVIVRYVL